MQGKAEHMEIIIIFIVGMVFGTLLIISIMQGAIKLGQYMWKNAFGLLLLLTLIIWATLGAVAGAG